MTSHTISTALGLRPLLSAVIAAVHFFVVGISLPFLIAAQEIDTILEVINDVMESVCFIPCTNVFTGNEVIPGTKCQWYHYCEGGTPLNIVECGDGLWFDPARGFCDAQIRGEPIDCPPDPQCPTPNPTDPPPQVQQTEKPTREPTAEPTTFQTPNDPASLSVPPMSTPDQPSVPQPTPGTPAPTRQPVTNPPVMEPKVITYIESKRELIDQLVLLSYNGATGLAYPSKQYTFNGLMQSLRVMGISGFGADFKFMLWEFDDEKWMHGLVNLAAFLANAMVESIEQDTCEELNWQQNEAGMYPIANSCGQETRSYQDENCPLGSTEFLSCGVNPDMYVTAVSRGTQPRAPPPLKCRAGIGEENYAGHWDPSRGRVITNATANAAGRSDIEGCCWWGRGALLSRGVCSIGKINYYLGKRGADIGRSTLYPKLDFCRFPSAPCTSANGEQLRWTVAMLEWAERVQRYETVLSSTEDDAWNFALRLDNFVDGGMNDDGLIDGLSRILSLDCHKAGCSNRNVRMLNKRRSYFYMIIEDVFGLKTLLGTPAPTDRPTRQPTPRPTAQDLPVTPPPVQITTTPPPTWVNPWAENIPPVTEPATPGPASQLEQPQSSGSTSDFPTIDANNGELIGIESNAGRAFARLSRWKLLTISIALGCQI